MGDAGQDDRLDVADDTGDAHSLLPLHSSPPPNLDHSSWPAPAPASASAPGARSSTPVHSDPFRRSSRRKQHSLLVHSRVRTVGAICTMMLFALLLLLGFTVVSHTAAFPWSDRRASGSCSLTVAGTTLHGTATVAGACRYVVKYGQATRWGVSTSPTTLTRVDSMG